MSRQAIEIEGLPELKVVLARKAAELHRAAELVVRQEVDEIRDDAVQAAPRDTGNLESGITATAAGTRGQVRSTARHASFVEHGTYKDAAQPYMAPSAEASRKRLPRKAAALIRAALGG